MFPRQDFPASGRPRTIAIIPARGGSKRIPRKNIRSFRGKPIIEWSISAALRSDLFDVVMVSTDDSEISAVALSCGADVPFMRSSASSGDYSTTVDVLNEVLGAYAAKGEWFDLVCCLYPTAPFIQPQDLIDGAKLLSDSFDVIMPVARFDYPIWRSLTRDVTGRLTQNFPENQSARSQDLPAAYHDAGQWYWFKVGVLDNGGDLMGCNTGSIVIPSSRVQDIDTEDDWILAEVKHKGMVG